MTHKYKRLVDFKPISSKTALVRVSLDLPTDKDHKISSLSRILNILPTIEYLQKHHIKIILIGHRTTKNMSLKIVSHELSKYVSHTFIPSVRSPVVEDCVSHMQDEDVLLLENLRTEDGEKENDKDFAKLLASLADFYVFEDFPVAHRRHASVVGIPKYLPSYAGIYFDNSIKQLEKYENQKETIGIFGGAKAETKIKIIESLIPSMEKVFVGGIIANSILKANGFNIGHSIFSDIEISENLRKNKKLFLPIDFIIERYNHRTIRKTKDIKDEDFIADIGPQSIIQIEKAIKNAKYIIANGPVGFCSGGYVDGSKAIANAILNTKAKVLLGGGDILSTFPTLKFGDNITALDGGGAFLYYLQHRTLPALDALNKE